MVSSKVWVVRDCTPVQLKELQNVTSLGDRVLFVGDLLFNGSTNKFMFATFRKIAGNKEVLLPENKKYPDLSPYNTIKQSNKTIRLRYHKYDRYNEDDVVLKSFKVGINNDMTDVRFCDMVIPVNQIKAGKVWRFDQLVEEIVHS